MMEIDDDAILQNVAANGSMDYSVWPALLPRVIARINKISHEVFPIPHLPPPPPPPQLLPLAPATTIPSSPSVPRAPGSDLSENFLAPLPSSPTEPQVSSSPSDTNKEANPIATAAAPLPASSPRPAESSVLAPAASTPLSQGSLPPQIAAMVSEITLCLESTFPTHPPHTIQRVAELVINPRQHYRSLATYLHALDRAVHVTSGSNIYPLPLTQVEIPGSRLNGMLEASSHQSSCASPGSDEALGGALLTPIPWLTHNRQSVTGSPAQSQQIQTVATGDAPAELEREVRTESTETIDGPNGIGSIETVSVSVNGISSMGARGIGVTQGELLRQEQRAGVVPVSQLVPNHHVLPGPNVSVAAQHQQQIQARIQQQRALAQSQIQARGPSSAESPDSPDSHSTAGSTASSTTLEGDDVHVTDSDNVQRAIPSVHSNNTEDEEKPHARGPEEIGANDLGPQTARTSTHPESSTAGSMMQGIDIQAAVGRKPLDISMSLKSDAKPKDNQDNDKMDIEDEARTGRASTPKRDAEDQLEGSTSKKLKGKSPSSSSAQDASGDPKPTEDSSNIEESDQGDAMDKD
ncbi:hypothetical protein GGS21DRAFT_503055 [Xylaria nigripes]|nr:hypothetical protein GGS21DRAFT_503055 [Xylaria nigripes]